MPLNIRSAEVSALADALAKETKLSRTDAVKQALENELARIERRPSLYERLKPLQEELAHCATTGESADKAFYDSIWNDSK